MKFVHIADIHLDAPFQGLNNVGTLGGKRRLEQRKVFKKVIDYIKQNQIDYLFIAGDLYENDYIKKSTIEYINELFKEIEQTKILITPGNHDPYIKNSYYENFEWNDNVYICKKEFEIVQEDEVDFYLTAFTDFYQNNSPIEKINIVNKNKINILITHCDLNGSKDENGYSYNPILESRLNNAKFDYVAMGHIHKSNFMNNLKNIYPGSLISFGFDELGEHGMIVGEISKSSLDTRFVKLDDRIFKKVEFDVKGILSQEEIIEKIGNLELEENNMYEIILVGDRECEINEMAILKLLNKENILKVKDCTQLGYNIEELAKENNLRGIFVREVIKKYDDGIYTEDQIKKAIEIRT